MKNTYKNNSSMTARQSMKESAADSQQFASAECAANNALDYIKDIKTAFQSPEEAMEALRVMRNHLNMRGDYNIVTPHTGDFNMGGLRNLTLSINNWEAVVTPEGDHVSFLRNGKLMRTMVANSPSDAELIFTMNIMSEVFKEGHKVWWMIEFGYEATGGKFVTLADGEGEAWDNFVNSYGDDGFYFRDAFPISRRTLECLGTSEHLCTDVKDVSKNVTNSAFAPEWLSK